MTAYETSRRQCRTLEALLDAKLSSYSRMASAIPLQSDIEAGTASERRTDVEDEIETLLDKLAEANSDLARTVDGPADTPSSSLHAVQRHREVLQDYRREFSRTKNNLKEALDHHNLLSNVRNDIDAYKSSSGDSLLAERGRIDSSHRMIDDITSQAYETRAEFGRQRTTLSGINSRMGGVLNQIPGIDSVIGMIRSKRRRDAIILGVVISLCILFLLGYVTR